MSTALSTVQEMPKSQLAQALVRARALQKAAREHTKQMGRVMVAQVLAGAGGATAGFLAVKFPLIPRTQIPTDVALGAALGLGAALDMFDGANDYVGAFAMGLVGAAAARETQKLLTR